jgi:hypothetical protein
MQQSTQFDNLKVNEITKCRCTRRIAVRHSGSWMPHVSTVSPDNSALSSVVFCVFRPPYGVVMRMDHLPVRQYSGTAANVTRNPDRTGARVSCTGMAETTMTSSVPWGRPIMLRGQAPRHGRRILQTYSALCSAFGTRSAAHGSCDET